MTAYTKDPSAVLDYKWDWKALTNGSGLTDWLQSTETISTITITATAGLIIDSSSITDSGTTVTVWISGGTDATSYTVSCKITTNMLRTDERSIIINVANR